LATGVAAYAAFRAARESRSSVAEMRKAWLAELVVRIREQQRSVHEANRVLSDFLRQYEGAFLISYRSLREKGDDPKRLREIEEARYAIKSYFSLIVLLMEFGLLTCNDIRMLIGDASVEIFLGIVEHLEKLINPDYDQRPLVAISSCFNRRRFPLEVRLVDRVVDVEGAEMAAS
jgi:hypothetical protein